MGRADARSRHLAGLCIGLPAAVFSGSALAQPWPAKPIRWIIPFPPGGGTDIVSRSITSRLGEALGVQVVAENRAGSGGTIGLTVAAKMAGDGYAIVTGQLANVGIAPALYPKLPYDPLKDLAPVTNIVKAPLVLVAHPSLPAGNLRELVTLARARPGALTYGSPGSATTGHIAMEMVKTATKTDILHIPYKGQTLALTELIGGQITLYISSIPTVLPMLNEKRLKAIGITSATRSPALPKVPPIAEGGIPGYDVTNWYGVFVPAGTPRDIVARLNREIVRIIALPELKERFTADAGVGVGDTPEQFDAFIRSELQRWSKAVKDSGARAD
jgi:tripartite-type tricarboxylate transporter receptor subunit TctC